VNSNIIRVFSLVGALITMIITQSYATHNRAGEITYEQIGDLTIRVTITTYTKTSSIQADRDSLELFWGDGTSSVVARANGFGDILPNDIKRNFYIAEHTYPGRATYVLSMNDPNRIGGILNVNPPNSIKIRFHIETSFTFLNTQFQGFNSSAILLQPPIDFACIGQRFVHNPNAFDPDGDSLSYEMIIPLEDVGSEVPNYLFPNQINPGPDNQLTLDERTGDIIWDAPQRPGEYNIAFKIHEYRQGVLINSIIRDMQIFVEMCDNQPPEIDVAEEICVVAGERVVFDVEASDDDVPQQQLSLTALGGPFEQAISPASFSPDARFYPQPLTGTFIWDTKCEHISEQSYSVVFKAVDDFFDTTGLAALKTLRIKVVGPPPQNVRAISEQSQTRITWDKPYACDVVADEYFRGFTVWRRSGSNQFPIDTCSPGLAGKGYEAIAFFIDDMEDGKYFYIDMDTKVGESFCYRVTATFAKTSAAGNPYNIVESLPSNEDCAGLTLDVPYITEVSVLETDAINGTISITWTKPDAEELDTMANPGPYRYTLVRGNGFNPSSLVPVPGASFTSQDFALANDTSFLDQTGLDTESQPYTYRVLFYAGDLINPLNRSQAASSVYLSVRGSDNQNILSWETEVPWENYSANIFRKEEGNVEFEFIGTSFDDNFIDNGLTNGVEYCYYVETTGSYGFVGLPEPLINLSQIKCERPFDAIPPCTPELAVTNSCDDNNPSSVFVNRLSWQLPIETCANPEDVSGYRLYFAPTVGTDFDLIGTIDDPSLRTFEHGSEFGIAGCYTVTALDSLDNESDTSNIICVENCPFYTLPNTFTPNLDGANDLFKPFPYKFIDQIDLRVFNRWGQVVFETTDPEINWDGKNLAGSDLADGVYYYTCRVFESRLDGVFENPTILSGYIELIR